VPRVTDEYRAGRRSEILSAAARRFARDGFHATSMADIITESGLSAGAVYRYFRSKEELIAAAAETALSTADELFGRLLADGATPSPDEAVAAMVQGIVGRVAHDPATGVDLTRLAVQGWAEALRNPDLGSRVDNVYRRLRGHCAEVARRWQAAGNLPADARPEQVGAAMLGLVQGFLLQSLLLKDTTKPGYLAGVRALLRSAASHP
jgi:AcrR family transcriptional regulator